MELWRLYPSSTTLLVLCVLPTLVEQIQRRMSCSTLKRIITILAIAFSAFMVIGRLISGVHWFTDIVGGVLLSAGLFTVYKAVVMLTIKSEIKGGAGGGIPWKASGIKKEPRFDTRRTSRGIICFKNCNFKMGIGRGYPSIDSLKEISRYFCVHWWAVIRRSVGFDCWKRKQVKSQWSIWLVIWIYRFALFDAYFSSIVFQTGWWIYLFSKSYWVCR